MSMFARIIVGLVVGGVATRLSMAVAERWGIVDPPAEIKIHAKPIPRIGGGAIVLASALAFLLKPAAGWGARTIPILAGGLLVALTGVLDDVHGLEPHHKLLGQMLAGVTLLFCGGWRSICTVGRYVVPGSLAVMLFICFMSNGFNLLDGMDGLAGGATVIMSLFLLALALMDRKPDLAALLASLIGACLGFLIFNVPPARTFMGDTGSLFLGYTMAVAALRLFFSSPLSLARLLGVALVLGLPMVDTCLAVTRRLSTGHRVFAGDRLHLYDGIYRRLNRDSWRTLLAVWTLTALCGALGVLAFTSTTRGAVLIAATVAVGMLALAHSVGSISRGASAVHPGRST